VTPPTPAIVTQNAVSPLPRWALLLLCIAYVVPGFVGRDPWKNADVTAFGYMLELAQGHTPWLSPLLGGMPPETEGLLPYWLGAWAVQMAPAWLPTEVAARMPFIALLAITLIATWYGVYYLARSPGAQPVAFAFGGEAPPLDYARAIADGALLALIACLGLAQLSHEVTSYLAQLGCTALLFFAVSAMPHRTVAPAVALVLGMAGLTLSGAPALTAMLGIGGAVLVVFAPAGNTGHHWRWAAALGAATLAMSVLAQGLDLWRWRIAGFDGGGKDWLSLARLLLVVWLASLAAGAVDLVALAPADLQPPRATASAGAPVVHPGVHWRHRHHPAGRQGLAARSARHGRAGGVRLADAAP